MHIPFAIYVPFTMIREVHFDNVGYDTSGWIYFRQGLLLHPVTSRYGNQARKKKDCLPIYIGLLYQKRYALCTYLYTFLAMLAIFSIDIEVQYVSWTSLSLKRYRLFPVYLVLCFRREMDKRQFDVMQVAKGTKRSVKICYKNLCNSFFQILCLHERLAVKYSANTYIIHMIHPGRFILIKS